MNVGNVLLNLPAFPWSFELKWGKKVGWMVIHRRVLRGLRTVCVHLAVPWGSHSIITLRVRVNRRAREDYETMGQWRNDESVQWWWCAGPTKLLRSAKVIPPRPRESSRTIYAFIWRWFVGKNTLYNRQVEGKEAAETRYVEVSCSHYGRKRKNGERQETRRWR